MLGKTVANERKSKRETGLNIEMLLDDSDKTDYLEFINESIIEEEEQEPSQDKMYSKRCEE